MLGILLCGHYNNRNFTFKSASFSKEESFMTFFHTWDGRFPRNIRALICIQIRALSCADKCDAAQRSLDSKTWPARSALLTLLASLG